MYIYFPSCNFQKQFPETAAKIRSYMDSQPDVTVAGCCKVTTSLPSAEDTIVTVCMSCMHLLEEMRPDVRQINLFEFLLERETFDWPDLNGETYLVQDCFRARGYHSLQDAVRTCLAKMNARVLEMENNRDQETYDGSFLFHPAYPNNIELAPKYYKEYLTPFITPVPQAQWKEKLREHAALYDSEKVVCYCNVCTSGAKEGGADARHLAELIFS